MKPWGVGGAAAVLATALVVAGPSSASPAPLALGQLVRITTPGTTACPAEGEPEVTQTVLGTWVAYNDDHQCPWLPTMTRILEVQLVPPQGRPRFIPLDAPAGQLVSGDPDLAPAPDGGVYLATLWSGADNEGGSIRVLHIDRHLRAHALPTPSLHHASNSDDKEFMAVDDHRDSRYRGRVYVVWDDFNATQTALRAWDGRRWLKPVKLQGAIGKPDVAVGPHGVVAAVFETANGIATRISHNGGRTFSAPQTVIHGTDPGYVDPSCPLRPTVGVRQRALMGPRVTFDRAGDVHVVASIGHYLDLGAAQQGLQGEAVVHHAVVRAGRLVRDEPVTVPTSDEQWAATVAALPDGGVAVSWLQTNAPRFTTYDAWIAAKPAGARAFAAPERLSPTSSMFPAAMEAEGNSNCYGVGDYIGMVATRNGVASVWPTTDTATPGVDSDVLLRFARLV